METLIRTASRAALKAAAAKLTTTPFTAVKGFSTYHFTSGKPMEALIESASGFASSFAAKHQAAAVEPATPTPIQSRFLKVKNKLTKAFDDAIERHGLDRTSFEAGHKIIAFRSTVLSRVHTKMMNDQTNPIEKAVEKLGVEETQRRIAANKIYNRFTMHPTEGQNSSTIFRKHALVQIATLAEQVERDDDLYAESIADFVKIHRGLDDGIIARTPFASEVMRKLTEDKIAPSKEDFLRASGEITDVLIDEFVAKPIHHLKKITVDDERDVTMHHLSRCRKDVAKMVSKNPEITKMSDVEFSSWLGDRDGKPHVNLGHIYKTAKRGQKVFFEDLLTSLEAFKTFVEVQGIDSADLTSEVIEPIQEMASLKPVFFGEEAKAQEARISKILEKFAETHTEASSEIFSEAQNYVKDSGCKVARNMTSTRQEVDKTNAAFDEIMNLEEIKALGDFKDVAKEEIARVLAENFSKISKDAQKEVLFMMESSMLNEKHEHVISQFDCEAESYKKALRLFQVCQQLPQFHESIPELRESYKDGIYEELFNPNSIAAAKKSFIELSPLAEDDKTIPQIISFTKTC